MVCETLCVKRTPQILAPPNYLRAWREWIGYDPEDLARAINVARSTIVRFEERKTWIEKEQLINLLRFFNIEVADLFGRDPQDKESIWYLARILRRLSPDDRDLVVAMIKHMLQRQLRR